LIFINRVTSLIVFVSYLISFEELIPFIVYNVSWRQNEFVCFSPRSCPSVQRTSTAVSLPRICPSATSWNDDAPFQDDETVRRRLHGRISSIRSAVALFKP